MDNKQDLTQGSIMGKLTRFFFPILFGLLFFQLYNTVDAVVVGRCIGPLTLDVAPMIFSGGLGLGSRAAFARLALLAERCGAMLGASRGAVAAGYADYRFQIGQTGVSVQPKLYVAFGISGAVQHLSGILRAGQIVAVNTDPRAPILEYADYAVIADANQIIEELLKRFA